MDAIRAITERVSVAQLTGPDITQEQKEILFKAALRAPDHAWMRPSRYLTIEGEAREELGKIFYKYQAGREVLSPEKAKKIKNMLFGGEMHSGRIKNFVSFFKNHAIFIFVPIT